ncbi:MAG: GNAT family N-acetyltransferase [Chloroflexi bacterium]|nr:MAG: GNAT family N-acetyltransferase [Chloroflexota bacterium]
MNYERMRVIQYTGEIWDNESVHPELWDLLQQTDLLIEVTGGQAPFQVVLGVPHHAGPGVNRIAEDWINPKNGQAGRPADETTGLTGLAVFSALRERDISCKLVVAAHPTDHDPNKTPGCPYWKTIFDRDGAGPPRLLLELHGASLKRRHGLELSAGQNSAAEPLLYGKALAYFMDGDWILAIQEQPGTDQARLYRNGQSSGGRLQNPALETLSLIYAGEIGMPALHLEMKSDFRQPDPAFPTAPRPARLAWRLARALASTLEMTGRPDDIHISAASLGLPSNAFLTRPALYYEDSYLSAVMETDFREMNGNPELRVWTHEGFVSLIEGTSQVIFAGLPEQPAEEFLWLIDQGEFIGRAFFLHWLNGERLRTDGQVDYWIRPSRRRQGYGKIILRLLLERFHQLGLKRILITCRTDNLPSRKIIEANGGMLDSEIFLPGTFGEPEARLRYWIFI